MNAKQRDLWCTLNAFLLAATQSDRETVVDALFQEHHHRPPWILRVQHVTLANPRSERNGKAKRDKPRARRVPKRAK